MARLGNPPGHPGAVDERHRRTGTQRRDGKQPERYEVTVRGAVPKNIMDLVGQAHATAILTVLPQSARDWDESDGPVSLRMKDEDYREEVADEHVSVSELRGHVHRRPRH